MKKITQLVSILSISLLAFNCDRKDDGNITPQQDLKEYNHLRVLVSDELTSQLSLVNPAKNEVQYYNAKFPKSALYSTMAGRFAAIAHTSNNLSQFFDLGLELHGDHVDVEDLPKMAQIEGTGPKPTHYKSKNQESIFFNDGDATLSYGHENDFNIPGEKLKTITTGLTAHHGAMAKFNNGNYAITEKDGSVTGSLPERVRIINTSGTIIFASTIQTKGIHGNATDGDVAVFGSASGILVVKNDGTQKLIKHPSDFGTAWFGTILQSEAPLNKFIGFTAAKGAYFINAYDTTTTPIVQSTDIMQCKIDYSGNKLIVLMHSGEVQVYNLANNTLISKSNIITATARDDKQKSQMVATDRFIYVTDVRNGALLSFEINNLSKRKSTVISRTPWRIALVGHEMDLTGNK